jgi:hypothetical protein
MRRQTVTRHRVYHVETIELGHPVIEQGYRRLVFSDGGKRGTPIGGLGDDPHRPALFQSTDDA